MCAQARVAGRRGERSRTARPPEEQSPLPEGLHGVTEGARVEQVGVEPKGRAVAPLVMAGYRSRAIS
jgi:hypothetical protein